MKIRLGLWLLSIRDAFVSLLPLTLFGVAATLLRHFPGGLDWLYPSASFAASWEASLEQIIAASHGVFGLALAVAVALHLVPRLPSLQDPDDNPPPMMVGAAALVNFMLCSMGLSLGGGGAMGYEAMLLGIIVGLGTAELLRWSAGQRWLMFVDVPVDADKSLIHALRFCTPVIFCGIFILLPASALSGLSLLAPVLAVLADWLAVSVLGEYLATSVAILVNQAFWSIGVHGGHLLDLYAGDFFVAPGLAPDGQLAWRPLVDSFVLLGGSGATLGLIVAIRLAAAGGAQWRIARLGLLPSMFNINEVILFGLPVVLSPRYLVPFILVPLALGLLTLFAVNGGLFELQAVSIPWTTPPLISGWLLSGSWRGVLWQVMEIGLATLFYLPFVRRAEAGRAASHARLLGEVIEAVRTEAPVRAMVIRRRDELGIMGRILLAALRADIRKGALSMCYQPKHDRAGALVGLEALVRWNSRKFGPIPAQVAVNLAEDGGCIRELGYWVINTACAAKARWNALGHGELTLAINVSPSQLGDPGFAGQLALTLQAHGLNCHEIEIEITESQAIPDEASTNTTLQALSENGVRLSMDDFGMGYSSLLHLRRFGIHSIKIDGSLTRDLQGNPANADIIRAICALGKARQVEVVAEFVETREQMQALINMGCDVFQGYLYSPPLTEAACLEYFERCRMASIGCDSGADHADQKQKLA